MKDNSSNPFKNDHGAYLLRALFFETTGADKETVVYTLKDEDHEGYKSLYLLYLACNDLTEYEFANTYLGGWDHWTKLSGCSWFKPYLSRWREELKLKHKAEALKRIIAESRSSSRNAFTANKFLVKEEWIESDEKPKRGRPSKSEVEAEKRKLLESDSELNDIISRMELN